MLKDKSNSGENSNRVNVGIDANGNEDINKNNQNLSNSTKKKDNKTFPFVKSNYDTNFTEKGKRKGNRHLSKDNMKYYLTTYSKLKKKFGLNSKLKKVEPIKLFENNIVPSPLQNQSEKKPENDRRKTKKIFLNYMLSKSSNGNKRKNKFSKTNLKNKGIKAIDLFKEKFLTEKNGVLELPLLQKILPNKVKIKDIHKTTESKDEHEDDEQKKTKLKEFLSETNLNNLMNEKFKKMKDTIKRKNSKRPDEETEEGIEQLFVKFNKERAKKYNIVTNRTLYNDNNNQCLINIVTKDEIDNSKKNKLNNLVIDEKRVQRYLSPINSAQTDNLDLKKDYFGHLSNYEITSLSNQANRKVEKLFPDLNTFNLPKVLRENKDYSLKLLYDVFVEFKTLLKCCMVHNRNLNIHQKGIDFETFFHCNTKINQQGIDLSKKIFKALNFKTNLNYMPWQNYIDGMMQIKDPNIEHKLDLFFNILDENGDGSFDYNEVYNLSMTSLQRVLPEELFENFKNDKEEKKGEEENEKNKNNEQNIIHILAEFLTKFVFKLVDIDITSDIPIDLLRKKMDEKCKDYEFLEFFLCADNFA